METDKRKKERFLVGEEVIVSLRNKSSRVGRVKDTAWEGSLSPLEEVRKTLLQFSGIGPKTADVLLLFSAEKPTIPVDTHVNRVSKRLSLAPASGNYETIRQSLQALYKPRDYLAVHGLLIQHGRKSCKARKPTCTKCPINTLCPSNNLSGKSD